MSFQINLLIDNYADMILRSRLVIQGITEIAYQKKVPINTFFSLDTMIKALRKERRRFVIIISESKIQSEKLLWYLSEKEIHPIFINEQFSDTSYSFSNVMPNLHFSFYKLTQLILKEFTEPSAFVGYNKDSIADKLRMDGFLKAVDEYGIKNHVYINNGDIDQCIHNVLAEKEKYKNIICTNDVVALLLIKQMKEMNCDPMNFNITGYSNMKIGEFFKPSLTTIVSDYYSAGIMAVEVYVFLYKKKQIYNMYVNMDSDIIFRESTHLKLRKIDLKHGNTNNDEMIDFYGNESVKKMDSIESMLLKCDDTDMGILHDLLNDKTYEEIAENYFMAVNTVKYRLKKMEACLKIANRKELYNYLKTYDLSF